MVEGGGSGFAWIGEYLLPIVILIPIIIVGLVAFNEIGKSRGFAKTYTKEDLVFLKHSMMALGDHGEIVLLYEGIKESDVKIEFNQDKISVAETKAPVFEGQAMEWITQNTYIAYLVDDTSIDSPTVEISPLREVIDDQEVDKLTPYFYIGIDDGEFFVEATYDALD